MAIPTTTLSRRCACIVVAALSFALAACGSEVAPEDFVGVGGGVSANGAQGGVTPGGDVVATPGAAVPTGGAPTSTDATGSPGGSGAGNGSPGDGAVTSGGSSSGDGGAGTGGPKGGAATGVQAGSCDGFKNGPGITDDTITIATIADTSGAVANVFKSAHDAVNAYVGYFNSTSSICGRKLKVQTFDSGLSAGGSAEASKAACQSAFALVGSMSAFDSGGAGDTAGCGQPDIRAQAVERARQDAASTFQVLPIDTDHFFMQPWVWAKSKFGASAVAKSAFVYLNAGASSTIATAIMKGTEKLGYKWDKVIVVDITSVPNWNAYANQLKSDGITFVQSNLGAFTSKLKAAMEQAEYKPAFMADGSAYDAAALGTGSQAQSMEGAYLFTQTAMMEEASKVPEMALYQSWLGHTGGGAPAPTGAQSWAAARLFTQLAIQLGAKLSRSTMVAALKNVHNFNANGIITPGDPGARTTAKCVTVMQIKSGKFTRVTPFPYSCGSLS